MYLVIPIKIQPKASPERISKTTTPLSLKTLYFSKNKTLPTSFDESSVSYFDYKLKITAGFIIYSGSNPFLIFNYSFRSFCSIRTNIENINSRWQVCNINTFRFRS